MDSLKLEDLNLDFNDMGFGPSQDHKFLTEEAKPFKAYNYKEKIGKLSDFIGHNTVV
jgi:hypothetical protein